MKQKQQTIPPEELSLFCGQVAMLLKAGIPLHDGMETLAASYEDTPYGSVFIGLNRGLAERGTLEGALRQAGGFPTYMVGMVRVGENAGRLEEVMEALSLSYQQEDELRRSVRSAVLYPLVLILMMTAVIAILVISVLPMFQRVYDSLGTEVSLASGFFMEVGGNIGKVILILAGAFLLLLLLCVLLLQTPLRPKVLALLMRLFPPFRRAMRTERAGKFASVVSIMLASGMGLEQTLEEAGKVAGDPAAEACMQAMRSGCSFSQALDKTDLFEPIHRKMLLVGEAAGQLDTVMQNLAVLYHEKTEEAISRMLSWIEPLLVTLMSVVIGGILLSVMLPLLGILSSMA